MGIDQLVTGGDVDEPVVDSLNTPEVTGDVAGSGGAISTLSAEHLTRVSKSSVSEIDVTEGWDGGHDQYILKATGLSVPNDLDKIAMRISNNGTTYKSDTNYNWAIWETYAGNTNNAGNGGVSQAVVVRPSSNSRNSGFTLAFDNPNETTTRPTWYGQGFYQVSGKTRVTHLGGGYAESLALSGVRLINNTSTNLTGSLDLYGVIY